MSTIPTHAGIHHGHIATPPKQPKTKPERIKPQKHIQTATVAASPMIDLQRRAAVGARIEASPIPDKIKALRWHWGAFILPFWWLLFHRFYGSAVVYLVGTICLTSLILPLASHYLPGQLSLTFLVTFGLPAAFTANAAHKIAWRKLKYKNVSDYFEVENRWSIAGFILGPIGAAIGIFQSLHH